MEKEGLKPLPVGVQSFEELIRSGYLYVDKTGYVYEMLKTGQGGGIGGRYFLSRPRRFGKSLLLSTIAAVFEGKRDLFKGLYIDEAGYDWKVHPVLRFDFSRIDANGPEILREQLMMQLANIAESYDLRDVLNETGLKGRFSKLIKTIAEAHGKVVVLVDEYDKAILDRMNDTELALGNRDVLRDFYTILKAQDEYLRFVFLTGVTKFSKMSVFSGLNNLNDISMDEGYAGSCGYTQDELEDKFDEYIDELASTIGQSKSATLGQIKHWYNGYRFSEGEMKVYNPFSSVLLMDKQKFISHWYDTGTPKMLIDVLKKNRESLMDIVGRWVSVDSLGSFDIENLGSVAALFQTGYLTISDVEWRSNYEYLLDFPNYEVRFAFTQHLLNRYSEMESEVMYLRELEKSINNEDIDEFFEIMRVFFKNIPNTITLKYEKYYQTILYCVLTLLGMRMEVEVNSNLGRMDAVIETDETIHIMEFKVNGSAEEAMAQVKKKDYGGKYARRGKRIELYGVSFEEESRNIGVVISEELV